MNNTRYMWSLALWAALVPALDTRANEQDGKTRNTNARPHPAVVSEQCEPAPELAYAPYLGYGSVTILCTGELIVRMDGDPRSSDPEWREPVESYVFSFVDTDGLRLVNADGYWFIDQNGEASRRYGLSPADVSTTDLPARDSKKRDGCKRQAVLDVRGEMTLELAPDGRYGFLQVWDSETLNSFTAEFASVIEAGWGNPSAPLSGGGACDTNCPEGDCDIVCGLGILRCARCYCATDGTPVCECYWCWQGGGFAVSAAVSQQTPATCPQSDAKTND